MLNNVWLQIVIGGCTFVAAYILLSLIFKVNAFNQLKNMLGEKLHK